MRIKPSHFETCVGITQFASLYRLVCPTSEYSFSRIALVLTGCTERHRFCFLSIYD